jgi:hypothetical protein
VNVPRVLRAFSPCCLERKPWRSIQARNILGVLRLALTAASLELTQDESRRGQRREKEPLSDLALGFNSTGEGACAPRVVALLPASHPHLLCVSVAPWQVCLKAAHFKRIFNSLSLLKVTINTRSLPSGKLPLRLSDSS